MGRAMRRRDFIKVVGGAAAVCPIAAHAQQTGQIHRIGFIGPAPDNPLFAVSYPEFLAELRKLGFTEGGNLIVENRRIDEGGQGVRCGGGSDPFEGRRGGHFWS